ncbi:hypothetical protein NDU88_001800 [Pleurodeles waltl]|uniref:Uncharacterized protein n=1 Tax=Pleurodeles waltl TaxID=8319 RepID=A0AAV7RDM0_PLEWA|nr:hypothetical protein NDU88_001800 [Pleurodeles waltl]
MPRRSPWRLGCQGNTQRMRRQSWKMHAQRLLRTDARAVLAPRKRLTPTAGVLALAVAPFSAPPLIRQHSDKP